MGRLADLLFVLVTIVVAFVVQYISGELLIPLRDTILDVGTNLSIYGSQGAMSGMLSAASKWGPLIAVGGSIVIVLVREHRRQRLAAVEQQRGPRR